MEQKKYPKEVLNKMQEIVDNCMGDAPAYCEATCPMHTDVKGYVNLIGKGQHKEAVSLIREKLFLPRTLGRVCAHPCEENCKRNDCGTPMSIAALKRFAADHYDEESSWDLNKESLKAEKIAIIGAGPAGAQAALDLVKMGYGVTVFEKLPVVGGMMRVGIPEYRLPRDVIDHEYSYLEKLGVKVKLGVEIGKDITFEQLEKDYQGIIVAVGAHGGVIIPVKGHDLKGVDHAVNFLRDVSLTGKANIGKKVAVIGGGNVAIDVARSARRVGAEKVYLICLEDKPNMPAHGWEVEEAVEEGITLYDGYGTEEITGEKGAVKSIKLKKCLSIFDKDGKFNPSYDMKQIEDLDVENVIFAVGQSVDASFANEKLETGRGNRFTVDPVTLQTNNKKVFVAGDASGRSVIVIEAMAEGRKAATSLDRHLRGEDLYKERDKEGAYKTWLETELPEEDQIAPRMKTTCRKPAERIKDFKEVDYGFSEEDAVKEATRCLSCECKLCMKECVMLNDYCECPKDLFGGILETGQVEPIIPFSCNMCSQCTLACPKDFPIKDRFMEVRKEMVKNNNGKSPMKGHNAIEMHQALGFSKLFNVAEKSKTGKTKRVFIPGCSLPSYNSDLVGNILEYLQTIYPDIGCILKCCGKPTKALGQYDKFKERYGELQKEIDKLGADEIIVACQSCFLTMTEYSPNQKVTSLWELLPEIGLPEGCKGKGKDSDITFAIHDSCSTRNRATIHEGVRWIIDELGYKTEEPPHTKENAKCCGFGGMIVPANPDLAGRVMNARTAEVESDYMVTYCAACRESMVKGGKQAVHLLDLVFNGPWDSSSEFPEVPGSPLTSWGNRYKSKKTMKKKMR